MQQGRLGIDLTRMECKEYKKIQYPKDHQSIDLTRMECKGRITVYYLPDFRGIDLTRMECKDNLDQCNSINTVV